MDAFKHAHSALLDKQGVQIIRQFDDRLYVHGRYRLHVPRGNSGRSGTRRTWPKAMSMGKTPDGKALKFVHRGSYDNMDNTYEAITNHLDDKKLEAKDTFIEEYHHRSAEDRGGQAGDQCLRAAEVVR